MPAAVKEAKEIKINIPANIGDKIDLLHTKREQMRAAQAIFDGFEAEYKTVELALAAQMKAEGVSASRGNMASFSFSESIVPQVEDWDRFYAYISRHKYFHLLDRRPSVAGCRELFETKGSIPGVVPFTKQKYNLNTL